MSGLSVRELDILIAADASADGTIPISRGMNQGNGGHSLISLLNRHLVAIITLEGGERRVAILKEGQKRLSHGPWVRSAARVQEAIRKTSSERFGMRGYAPGTRQATEAVRGRRAQVEVMLRRKQGATAAEIAAELSWKPASVRGLISSYFLRTYGNDLVIQRGGRSARYFLRVQSSPIPEDSAPTAHAPSSQL